MSNLDAATSGPSLCVLSLAPLRRDARVLRQIALGRRLGFRVTAVAWGDLEAEPLAFQLSSVVPHRFPASGRAAQAALVAAGRLRPALWQRWYWRKPDHRAALAAVQRCAPDVVHANETIALPLAVRAAAATGARVLFDAHELALDQRKGPFVQHRLAAALYRWMLTTYAPRCDAMISVAPGIARLYARALGVPCGVVRNAPPYRPMPFRPTDPQAIRIVHHGVALRGRRLEDAIRLVAALDQRYRLRLMLVPAACGYLADLQALAARLAPDRVEFREPVGPDAVVDAIADCDLGLAVIPPVDASYRLALPNKLFDYLMAGLGVVLGPSPEMLDVCRPFACGLVARDHTVDSVAALLADQTAPAIDACKRGSLAAAKVHNAEREMAVLATLYERLLAGDPPWHEAA